MNRLIKNIILFLIPLFIILLFIPVNKQHLYRGLKDDCNNRAIWMYDRIYNNSTPIDIAFIGSSHTINGINDEMITEKIKCLKAVNLGYCRLGRNLTYVIVKELTSIKEVQYVIIEVMEDEDRYSHPVFPLLANTSDVLFPKIFFNKDYLTDLFDHFSYRLNISQDLLFQKEYHNQSDFTYYGFLSTADTANKEFLDEVKLHRNKPEKVLSKMEINFYNNYPREYLKMIAEICKVKNIKMLFLYIPSYATNVKIPKEYNTYKQYGELIIPPQNIFEKQSNWYDENHLNKKGANELSTWIAEWIQDKLLHHSN